MTATRTLSGLTPGTYTISASNVVNSGTTYTASVSNATMAVAAGASPTVTVSYTAPTPPTLNLRIQELVSHPEHADADIQRPAGKRSGRISPGVRCS